jgi:hypothetical protein
MILVFYSLRWAPSGFDEVPWGDESLMMFEAAHGRAYLRLTPFGLNVIYLVSCIYGVMEAEFVMQVALVDNEL